MIWITVTLLPAALATKANLLLGSSATLCGSSPTLIVLITELSGEDRDTVVARVDAPQQPAVRRQRYRAGGGRVVKRWAPAVAGRARKRARTATPERSVRLPVIAALPSCDSLSRTRRLASFSSRVGVVKLRAAIEGVDPAQQLDRLTAQPRRGLASPPATACRGGGRAPRRGSRGTSPPSPPRARRVRPREGPPPGFAAARSGAATIATARGQPPARTRDLHRCGRASDPFQHPRQTGGYAARAAGGRPAPATAPADRRRRQSPRRSILKSPSARPGRGRSPAGSRG